MNDPSTANWITVNERLEELAKAQAALDYDVGRWLLAAHRLNVHARLGRGSFTGEGLDDETALLMMARGALEGRKDASKDEGRAGYQIAITKCPECGRGQQQGRGELIDIGSDILEMAECDAQCIGDPTASELERATQTIPPATRRQVIRRDHGQCVVPGVSVRDVY